jgi:uncharacterized protein
VHLRIRRLLASSIVVVPMLLSAALPAPSGYVNDFASVLDDSAEQYLEGFLETLERDTTAEVVVATVASLDGMTVEEYANRLFAEWGIGQAADDNGVLLLVAPRDRAVRIEVGYGLEPILPDGLAGEIIRAEILPEFRAGNIPRGIGRGLNRISQIVRRDPQAAARAASPSPANDLPPAWFVIPFFATFVGFGSFSAGLGLRTKTYAPLMAGGMFVGIPLLIALTVTSLVSLAFFAVIGVAALALGYRRGLSAYWMGMLRKGRPDSATDNEASDWIMGGTPGSSSDRSSDSGSDSGGSSSSGGDFGGGSSGGGGASGRW